MHGSRSLDSLFQALYLPPPPEDAPRRLNGGIKEKKMRKKERESQRQQRRQRQKAQAKFNCEHPEQVVSIRAIHEAKKKEREIAKDLRQKERDEKRKLRNIKYKERRAERSNPRRKMASIIPKEECKAEAEQASENKGLTNIIDRPRRVPCEERVD